jgi:eukaryotic-like serine/threonine-protein kinase
VQAFTTGLHDASLHGRVTEGTWRRSLLRLHDSVAACPLCGAAVFYDHEHPAKRCWDCDGMLPVPPVLKLPAGSVVLAEGAVVTSHHLHRDRDYHTARAVVEPHPGRPGRVVLRNLTDKTWVVVPDGEEPKAVVPGQRLGVRPMAIDFRGVHGQIML